MLSDKIAIIYQPTIKGKQVFKLHRPFLISIKSVSLIEISKLIMLLLEMEELSRLLTLDLLLLWQKESLIVEHLTTWLPSFLRRKMYTAQPKLILGLLEYFSSILMRELILSRDIVRSSSVETFLLATILSVNVMGGQKKQYKEH